MQQSSVFGSVETEHTAVAVIPERAPSASWVVIKQTPAASLRMPILKACASIGILRPPVDIERFLTGCETLQDRGFLPVALRGSGEHRVDPRGRNGYDAIAVSDNQISGVDDDRTQENRVIDPSRRREVLARTANTKSAGKYGKSNLFEQSAVAHAGIEDQTAEIPRLGGRRHHLPPVAMVMLTCHCDDQNIARLRLVKGPMQPEIVARRRLNGHGRAAQGKGGGRGIDGFRQRAAFSTGLVQGRGRKPPRLVERRGGGARWDGAGGCGGIDAAKGSHF